MKKIKIELSLEPINRKYLFEYDSEDREDLCCTEHFMEVLKYWWSRELNEET